MVTVLSILLLALLVLLLILAWDLRRWRREYKKLWEDNRAEREQSYENLEGRWAAEDETRRVLSEYAKLFVGIRKHMNAKGHDRCWLSDLELYRLVEPTYDTMGMQLPCLPEFLHNCCTYWRDSQPPEARKLGD